MPNPKGDVLKPKIQTDRVRADAQGAVVAAGARGEVASLFLTWAGERVYEDVDTHKVIGVDDALADFKIDHEFLFVSAAPDAANENVKRQYVDCDRDVTIQVGISWVTFRKGQRLDDPHAIGLAKAHGIPLIEK